MYGIVDIQYTYIMYKDMIGCAYACTTHKLVTFFCCCYNNKTDKTIIRENRNGKINGQFLFNPLQMLFLSSSSVVLSLYLYKESLKFHFIYDLLYGNRKFSIIKTTIYSIRTNSREIDIL